jgi:hypothetical protein
MPPLVFAGFAADGSVFAGVGVVVALDEGDEGDEGDEEGEEGGAAFDFACFAVEAGVGVGLGDALGDGVGVAAAAAERSGVGTVEDCARAFEIVSSRMTESSNPLIMIDDSCVSEEVAPLAR